MSEPTEHDDLPPAAPTTADVPAPDAPPRVVVPIEPSAHRPIDRYLGVHLESVAKEADDERNGSPTYRR